MIDQRPFTEVAILIPPRWFVKFHKEMDVVVRHFGNANSIGDQELSSNRTLFGTFWGGHLLVSARPGGQLVRCLRVFGTGWGSGTKPRVAKRPASSRFVLPWSLSLRSGYKDSPLRLVLAEAQSTKRVDYT